MNYIIFRIFLLQEEGNINCELCDAKYVKHFQSCCGETFTKHKEMSDGRVDNVTWWTTCLLGANRLVIVQELWGHVLPTFNFFAKVYYIIIHCNKLTRIKNAQHNILLRYWSIIHHNYICDWFNIFHSI